VLGGALVQGVGWRSIFWINIPVGALAIALTTRFVPESKAPHPRRFDPVGQILLVGLLALLVYGIIEAPSHGWGSPESLACFAVAGASLALLVVYELSRREPLIEPRFFRSAAFSGANVTTVCVFGALAGFLFLNTLYLQDVRHYTPLNAGLTVLPTAAMWMVLGPLSGRVVARRGPRPSLFIGAAAVTAAGLVSAIPHGNPPDARLYAVYFLMGAGVGCISPAITNTAVGGMPRHQAGVAAGINATFRQVGTTLGVAVIGSVIHAHINHVAPSAGFTDASRASWSIIAGCGLAALLIAAATSGYGHTDPQGSPNPPDNTEPFNTTRAEPS
jgi:MFS family permease